MAACIYIYRLLFVLCLRACPPPSEPPRLLGTQACQCWPALEDRAQTYQVSCLPSAALPPSRERANLQCSTAAAQRPDLQEFCQPHVASCLHDIPGSDQPRAQVQRLRAQVRRPRQQPLLKRRTMTPQVHLRGDSGWKAHRRMVSRHRLRPNRRDLHLPRRFTQALCPPEHPPDIVRPEAVQLVLAVLHRLDRRTPQLYRLPQRDHLHRHRLEMQLWPLLIQPVALPRPIHFLCQQPRHLHRLRMESI